MRRTIVFFLLISLGFLTGLSTRSQAQVSDATAEIEIPEYEDTLYIFDLNKYLELKPNNIKWKYDVINMVSALQGLVNRDNPQLYILYVREGLSGYQDNVDYFWLSYLRGGDNILSKMNVVYLDTLEEVLRVFRHYFMALVLWDPNVPSTGNAALTIAGADGFLPVRHDRSSESLYTQVVFGEAQLPSAERLSGKFPGVGRIADTEIESSGSAKTDAYLWANELYLSQGLCSPTYMANFLDPSDWDKRVEGVQYPDLQNCMIVNHDFYVGKKAFFMDLDPWWNEVPTDIPDDPFLQGIDYRVLVEVLMKTAFEHTLEGERILRIGGMVPWWEKYCKIGAPERSFHPKKETVEQYVGIMSAFNGMVDADESPFGALANASVFQHIPLKNRYYQNPVGEEKALEQKNYLLFVIGDFYSSALLYQTIPILWRDIMRGKINITWAFNPMVSERVPQVLNYMYETRTEKDFFVAGGTGPGLCYLNRYFQPRKHSTLENGVYFWRKYAKHLYQKFDLRTTVAADLAEVEIGDTFFDSRLQEPFRQFSQQGVSTVKDFENPLDDDVVPYIKEAHVFDEQMPAVGEVVTEIMKNSSKDDTTFQLYRFRLATPSTLYYIEQRLQNEQTDYRFEVVDPFTFFYLLRQQYGGNSEYNSLIPTYLSHSIPPEMEPEQKREVTVTMRNDGWDYWNRQGIDTNKRYRLTYRWQYVGEEEPLIGRQAAYIQGPVGPGETTTLSILLIAPKEAGLYRLILQFEQENVRESNITEEMRVVVQ